MKKRMLFLVILFFAVLVIPVGTQTTNMSVLNAESQHDLALASIPDPPDPPALPDPEDYTYHAPIVINLETWDDIIEEFDGRGTRRSPLKIRGLYFDGNPSTIWDPRINIDTSLGELEDNPYIDIVNCLFIGDYSDSFTGVLSRHVTGRLKIKNCVFVGNTYGVFLDHLDGMLSRKLIVKDCLFYEGSGAGVYLSGDDGGADITVKDSTFYAMKTGVYARRLYSGSRLEIAGCNIYTYTYSYPYGQYGVDIHESFGEIVIRNNHIDFCTRGIVLRQGTQGVTIKDNEISHCSCDAIWIQNGASYNTIKHNYIHNNYMEHAVGIDGHHNIIKSNKIEAVAISINCHTDSYENEIIWNNFTSDSTLLVLDNGEGNLWDFNYYGDYEGDGTEPYVINNWYMEPENQDLHPLGPEVPYIPPTPPDRADYTYHASIRINAETWYDIIEEFDGMGTRWSPLKIRGLYFEENEEEPYGIFIDADLEDVYIDIKDCLFIGLYQGVRSFPSSGRIRIKDCVFIRNNYGVYPSGHAEQIFKDCMFYGTSYGGGVVASEAYDVTVEDCTFYAVRRCVYASWEEPSSKRLEINRCDMYGGSQSGIQLVGNQEGGCIGISRCNIYNSYYGIYWNHADIENSLIDIDECNIYYGMYGIYFDSVVTGPNSVVLIHNSEIGWGPQNFGWGPRSTAIYLTGGCVGIVIDDNYFHHYELGIDFRQNESYNCISRNNIEYCSRAIWIASGLLSYDYEAQGNVISENEIAHISYEAVWFHLYTSENIFTGNYLHDNEIGDAEQWNMFIQGHHNVIKLNKFENLGAGHAAITLYFIEEICYENEITWNVFLDTDGTAISDESGVNILDYNYYADYEGDGSEPYVNQDLHPLGPELTPYFWWNLLCQYPSEVFQMWRWLT